MVLRNEKKKVKIKRDLRVELIIYSWKNNTISYLLRKG